MPNSSFRCLCIVAVSVFLSISVIAEDTWLIGTSAVDITPPTGLWLGGYAARTRPAEGAIHPLWVKAFALRDTSGQTGIIIGTDILGYTKELGDRIKQQIADRWQIPPANVILNSSHTHSGPVIEDSIIPIYPIEGTEQMDMIRAYTRQLEEKVIHAIQLALEDFTPCKLYAGRGIARFAVNRRNNHETEVDKLFELRGPVDHAVHILVAKQIPDTSIKGIVFNYACHATVLSDYQWCGDYPGFAQIELEQIYPTAKAIFVAGCGADINPIPRRSLALAKQYGKELASAVERAITDTLVELPPQFRTNLQYVNLLLETPKTIEELQKIAQDTTQPEYVRRSARFLLRDVEQGIPLRTSYDYPVQVWNVGGQPIVALAGEVVVEYAIFIKEKLSHNAMVLGFSNDLMSYIPSVRIIREGGYEGDTSQLEYKMPAKWKEDIESLIVNTVIECWNSVK